LFFCDEIRLDPTNCSFRWDVLSITDPTFDVEEDADEPCADGFVTLRLLGNGNMQLDWRYSQNEPIEASGTLTKS